MIKGSIALYEEPTYPVSNYTNHQDVTYGIPVEQRQDILDRELLKLATMQWNVGRKVIRCYDRTVTTKRIGEITKIHTTHEAAWKSYNYMAPIEVTWPNNVVMNYREDELDLMPNYTDETEEYYNGCY